MNTYKSNYKTVIKVTENENSSFSLDLSDEANKIKAIVLHQLGIDGNRVSESVLEFSSAQKEIKQHSHCSEYEVMMDIYWNLNKALITDYCDFNILNRIDMKIGKSLTNDNFKVILVNIDLLK